MRVCVLVTMCGMDTCAVVLDYIKEKNRMLAELFNLLCPLEGDAID